MSDSYPEYTATYSPEDNKLRLYALSRLPKELYDRVKAAGFKWAPKQDLFVAPMWTPDREDLLIELAGEIGDEDKSLVARQEERAERFEEYSDNRKEDANQAHAAVHRITDGIPLGQPILVGHHSERHARRDAEKIENGMRKAVKMWEQSKYWKDRAAGAIRLAKYKERPDVRARRIKGIESDIRVYRARFTPVAGVRAILQEPWEKRDGIKVPHVWCAPRGGRGGSWVEASRLPALEAYYTRWIAHCEHRLEYEKAMLDEQGASELLQPKPRPTQLPLCNYRAPGGLQIENIYHRGEMMYYPQVEMTQAEYTRISNDYKATRVVGHSHRVRTAMQKHSLVCVFLTDAKTHTPPEEHEAPPRELPEFHYTPAAPVEPEAAQFDAMKEQLKAGVQVVSAPQLFPTPPDLAQRMVDEADIPTAEPGFRILEPSAGTGAIIDKIFTYAGTIVAVEQNYRLAEALRIRWNAVDVHCSDFLECNGDLGKFDRILMNPPFVNGADIKHIQHARTFLKPGGKLVAICANGPRQNEQLQPLADSWEELPEGTFKEQGTGVRTVLLTMSAPDEEEGGERLLF